MCAKRFRKKNALGSGRSPTNVRPSGSEKIGSTSSMRAPSAARSCAWTSHTRTYPVQPHTKITANSASPDTHASARGPQLLCCAYIRNACTAAATTAASEANRCTPRIHRPSHA